MKCHGKLEKSQGKIRKKSGNSLSKIWQTPCDNYIWYIVLGNVLEGAYVCIEVLLATQSNEAAAPFEKYQYVIVFPQNQKFSKT